MGNRSSLHDPIRCVLIAHVGDRREELTTFENIDRALEAIAGTRTADLLTDADHSDTEVRFTVHQVTVSPRGRREWLDTVFEGSRTDAMKRLGRPTLRSI